MALAIEKGLSKSFIKLGSFVIKKDFATFALRNHGISSTTDRASAARLIVAEAFQQLTPLLSVGKPSAASKGLNLEQIVHKFHNLIVHRKLSEQLSAKQLIEVLKDEEKNSKDREPDYTGAISSYLAQRLAERHDRIWVEMTVGDVPLIKHNNDEMLHYVKTFHSQYSWLLPAAATATATGVSLMFDLKGLGVGAFSLLLATVPWLAFSIMRSRTENNFIKHFEQLIAQEQLEIIDQEMKDSMAKFSDLCGKSREELEEMALSSSTDPRVDVIEEIAKRIAEIKMVSIEEKRKLFIDLLSAVTKESRIDVFYKMEFYTTIEDHMRKVISRKVDLHAMFVESGAVDK